MRSYILPLLGLFLSFDAAEAATCNRCNANNCYRQVVASAFTTRHGSQDCSSYLATTVTPATITFTETVEATQTEDVTTTDTTVITIPATETDTVTATILTTETDTVTTTVTKVMSTVLRRDASPTSGIPAYASGCTAPGQYSSACSCIGVFPHTVTAPTPSATITQTLTQVVTNTVGVEMSILTTETLTVFTTVTTEVVATTTTTTTQLSDPAPTACSRPALKVVGGSYDGQYIKLTSNGGSALALFTTDKSSASTLTIDSDGQLFNPDNPNFGGVNVYAQESDRGIGYIYFDTQAYNAQHNVYPVICSSDPVTHYLSCTWLGATVLQEYNGYLSLGATSSDAHPLVLEASCV